MYIYLLGFFSHQLKADVNPSRTLKAIRIAEEVKIDGILHEKVWSQSEYASGFIQTEPTPGLPATFETQVYFAYDNNAVYIAARMSDPEPDKILKELSLRDQIGNADNFRIFFDTYRSGLNGFKFFITASGVQLDAVVTNNNDDNNWNAIWQSAVTKNEHGWYAEIKIPYSSLRFPSEAVQDWHVQFGREIRRFRETSYWSPIDPTISGWVQQSGKVTQIENIKSPIRLSLTPYISGYVNTTYDPKSTEKKITSGNAYSAGLDLKYGLNDAFTLDMTLVPDFGQVISDRQVLNLSPFEVFFEENRQFFTEGTELFNRGRLFYSRRIGGRPLHYFNVSSQLKDGETIIENPEVSQLFNATKISGRTSSGTGIGGFNAFVGEENALIRSKDGTERLYKTNPLTNYNVLVVDQNLKNNSYVSLTNTNVYRLGQDYDANVTGTFFNLKTRDQKYFISGSGVLSRKYFSEYTDQGHTYNVSLGKISGNWTYEGGHGVESDKYDPNDMGFLFSPNEVFYYLQGAYTQYKPKNNKLQQVRFEGSSIYSRLYKPDVFTDFTLSFENFVMWKSRFAVGFNAIMMPVESFDYFEPRQTDFSRFMARPVNYNIGGFVSSDYRRPFAYDIRLSYRHFDANQRSTTNIVFNPRIRFNDKFSVFTATSASIIQSEPGYVNRNLVEGIIQGLEASDILFGNRDRLIIENSITAKYIFNAVMGINIRARHYWDKVRYQAFGLLDKNGNVAITPFAGLNNEGSPIFDRNVNIFNIDLQYNWRFAPGSDIIFVWKNQIFNSDSKYERDYLANLGGLFDSVQSNNFSIRFIYFMDYLYLFPRKDS